MAAALPIARLAFALLAVGSIAAPAAAQTNLRWKFTKDQAFTVQCTQQTEVETSINNKPRRALLEMGMTLEWQVEEVDDKGTASIAQSFTKLSLKTTAPDADPVVYDSDSPNKPTGAAREVAAAVKPLLGAKFTVQMTARGDVQKVTLDDAAAKSLDELPKEHPLRQLLSPEGLANLFRLGGGQLPDKAVQSGDTWPAEGEIKTPYGVLKQTGEFTYAGPQTVASAMLEKIELKSTAKLAPDAAAPLKLTGVEQTKTGVLLFDAAAGRAVSSETRLESKSVRTFRDTPIQVKISASTKLEIAPK
jgi:hypothetical protein